MKNVMQKISFLIVLGSLTLIVNSAFAEALAQGSAAQTTAVQKTASSQASPAPVVNINTASSSEIMFLPGIGPSKADAIIAYRNKHRFVRKSQLLRVHGIGPKSLRKLRAMICVKGPTTMTRKMQAKK